MLSWPIRDHQPNEHRFTTHITAFSDHPQTQYFCIWTWPSSTQKPNFETLLATQSKTHSASLQCTPPKQDSSHLIVLLIEGTSHPHCSVPPFPNCHWLQPPASILLTALINHDHKNFVMLHQLVRSTSTSADLSLPALHTTQCPHKNPLMLITFKV
jgi:hypothetical protein